MVQLKRTNDMESVSSSRTASAGPAATTTMARWLPAARIAWAVIAVFSLGVFLVTVVLGYGQLIHVNGETRRSLAQAGLSPTGYALLRLALDTAFAAVFTIVGWVIYLRRRADWMALLTALALVVWGPHNGLLVGIGYGLPSTSTGPSGVGAGMAGLLAYGSWMLFFYLFPSGRFVPRWTRFCAIAWAVYAPLWATPIGASHWPWGLSLTSAIVLWGSFPVSQVYRYRRVSTPTQRLQTKWVVFGVVLAVVGFLTIYATIGAPAGLAGKDAARHLVATALTDAFVLLIPLSIGIAILKHRLFDIDLIVNRTLVYGALTALVIGGYVLIVGVLGTLFQAHGSLVLSLVATGIVAVLFQPARQRLQQGVNHLLYGDRDDPYAAIARLGRQLEAALAPEAVLPAVATTIREALKLPYAAIALQSDAGTAAAVGEPRGELLRLPLVHAGEPVGQLLLSPRAPGEAWTAAERKLLDDLAHAAGAAVQSVRLTQELQLSRERLVLAREEERRRLRRDLHDDLAPSLAALALTAATAADLIPPEAARARHLVEELQQALRGSVGAVRRLAHDLRPPTLDELGLVAAIRERAEQVTGAGSNGHLQVTVDAPDQLPPLSAAAEVATYRIVQEALMNVIRHAHAQRCLIRLAVTTGGTGSALEVTVTDDGVGLPDLGAGRAHGVGLRSMQERATELGGTCSVERRPVGGTWVRACLPIDVPQQEEAGGLTSCPDR